MINQEILQFQASIDIIIIMLSRIILHLRPAFARATKNRKLVDSVANAMTGVDKELASSRMVRQQIQNKIHDSHIQNTNKTNTNPSQTPKPKQKQPSKQKKRQSRDQQKFQSPPNKKKQQQQQKLRKQVRKLIESGLKQEQILGRYVPEGYQMGAGKEDGLTKLGGYDRWSENQSQGFGDSKMGNLQQNQGLQKDKIQLLKQQILITQIIKSQTQTPKQIPIGPKYQQPPNKQTAQQIEQRVVLKILAYNSSIIHSSSNLNSNGSESNGQMNLVQGWNRGQLDLGERVRNRYSQEVIDRAEEGARSQLSYYKELAGQKNIKQYQFQDQRQYYRNNKRSILDRRLSKHQSYEDLKERDAREIQRIDSERAMMREENREIEELGYRERVRKLEQRSKIQDVVEYQDQQYYKRKALNQYNNQPTPQDKQILSSAQADRQQASDLQNILLDQYQQPTHNARYRKQLYDESSFGMIERKMNDLERRLRRQGVEYGVEELAGMGREMLFREKKYREELQEYKKYLMRKEKKKKMKQYNQKIHKQLLRQNLDFNNDLKNRFKDPKYNPLDLEANLQKMSEQQQADSATLTLLAKDRRSEIHFKKTENNMRNFLLSCFYKDFIKIDKEVKGKVAIRDIRFNQKKTVANVFWWLDSGFTDGSKGGSGVPGQSTDLNEQEIRKIQGQLQKSSNFISGKMTQILGLRYGPQIRFYYDKILPQTKQMQASLQQTKSQVVDYQLQNLLKKGHITSQEQLIQKKQKLKAVADENIDNLHNREKLLSKKYRKAQREGMTDGVSESKDEGRAARGRGVFKGKYGRDPMVESGRIKKNVQDKFWEHIDKL